MTRRLLVIATLLGVLAVACGKYGPPVRVRAQPAAAASSETAEKAAPSAADESDEQGKRP